MAEIGALDHHWIAPIEWSRGPPNPINACALNAGVITVEMRSGEEHRDRWIAIQWRNFMRFYNTYPRGTLITCNLNMINMIINAK